MSSHLCICQNIGKSCCSECEIVYYCSIECQEKDSKNHKLHCNEIKLFNEFLNKQTRKSTIINKIIKFSKTLIEINYENKDDQFVFCYVNEKQNNCNISIILDKNKYSKFDQLFERYKNKNLLIVIITNLIGVTKVIGFPRVEKFITPETNKFGMEPISNVNIPLII